MPVLGLAHPIPKLLDQRVHLVGFVGIGVVTGSGNPVQVEVLGSGPAFVVVARRTCGVLFPADE